VLSFQSTPKGPSVSIATDKEYVVAKVAPQSINPKLLADNPAMSDFVTMRNVLRRNECLPLRRGKWAVKREFSFN
jgi:hypothetical protein